VRSREKWRERIGESARERADEGELAAGGNRSGERGRSEPLVAGTEAKARRHYLPKSHTRLIWLTSSAFAHTSLPPRSTPCRR